MARVAELVDARDLKSLDICHTGSIPVPGMDYIYIILVILKSGIILTAERREKRQLVTKHTN